jgi:hypothetical protein
MKYFKPTSLTWWMSFLPIAGGIIIATADIHGQAALVTSVNNLTGNVEPAVLINAGLVGIGLRAAL